MTIKITEDSFIKTMQMLVDSAQGSTGRARVLGVIEALVSNGTAAQNAACEAGLFPVVAAILRIDDRPSVVAAAQSLVAATTESNDVTRAAAILALAAAPAAVYAAAFGDGTQVPPDCLCAAATLGDDGLPLVIRMLDGGADPEGCGGPMCLRPLAEAAYADSTKVTRALLLHGAGVNKRTHRDKSTALHWCKSAKVALVLMQHGAKMTLRDGDGDTALMRHRKYKTSTVIEAALIAAARFGALA